MRPFWSGTQYMDWEASNYERCTKGIIFDLEFKCDIQEALSISNIRDGEITTKMAKRMGITDETKTAYVWPCAEVEWTEEWKKEYLQRKES